MSASTVGISLFDAISLAVNVPARLIYVLTSIGEFVVPNGCK